MNVIFLIIIKPYNNFLIAHFQSNTHNIGKLRISVNPKRPSHFCTPSPFRTAKMAQRKSPPVAPPIRIAPVLFRVQCALRLFPLSLLAPGDLNTPRADRPPLRSIHSPFAVDDDFIEIVIMAGNWVGRWGTDGYLHGPSHPLNHQPLSTKGYRFERSAWVIDVCFMNKSYLFEFEESMGQLVGCVGVGEDLYWRGRGE